MSTIPCCYTLPDGSRHFGHIVDICHDEFLIEPTYGSRVWVKASRVWDIGR